MKSRKNDSFFNRKEIDEFENLWFKDYEFENTPKKDYR
jgi:hypothetical protein